MFRASYPPFVRDSRTLQQIRTSQNQQKLPQDHPLSTSLQRGSFGATVGNTPSCRPAHPTHHSGAIAALCNTSAPPNPTKNFPTRPPPSTKANQIFARVMAGVLWGSSGRMREVWREREPSFKRVPSPSKVLPPHLLSESLYLRDALGAQSRANADNRVGKGQIFAVFQ